MGWILSTGGRDRVRFRQFQRPEGVVRILCASRPCPWAEPDAPTEGPETSAPIPGHGGRVEGEESLSDRMQGFLEIFPGCGGRIQILQRKILEATEMSSAIR